ncbi:DMT(drug/metabolite transporter) superfamily permease [Desulfocurvibacter africanus PCS]|uniref:DMT(Drug/metabolite transporter) superfamily permease n=1 Tax=Desulfocurvibacter africanus PCS TaxID=1262666 RepID=M5PR12_DESAF|nr:DMT family transporter [Desulfocurvibacter africanus]EMG36549.1 DMT(drug/metabolite transporter) superfamily permease [Desulfocurvibacter africanus PCS]
MKYEGKQPVPWTGFLCALGATIIWSGNFIVARGLFDSVQPATLAFLRWGTAFAALLPMAAIPAWRERSVIRRHFIFLLITALLGVTLFNTLIYLAARSTSALNLALISTTSPMFMLLLARMFLGEAVTPARLAGMTAAVCGVALLVTRGDLSRLASLQFAVGDLLMLSAAVLFAAYSILVRRKPRELGQASFLLSTFGLGVLCLAPWAAWEVLRSGLPPPEPHIIGAVLYIGLGASLASFFLWNKAVAAIGPSRAGIIYYSLPAFSGLEAFLLLGEPVGWAHLASGLLILGGILLATRR